nr:1416_t:CDS:2 [Entrophospora candida]
MCITCYDKWDDLSPETFLTLEIEKFYRETFKLLKDDPIINEDNSDLLNAGLNKFITAIELTESTKPMKLDNGEMTLEKLCEF